MKDQKKRDYIIFSALVKNSKWKSPLLSTCYFSSISWCVRSLSTFGIWDRRRRGGERRGREGGCLEIIWGRALIIDVEIAWQQAICPPGSALVANLLLQWTSIRRALILIIMFILLPDTQKMGRWTGSVDHKGCGFNYRLSEEAFQKQITSILDKTENK